jgi:hypothetical protein
MAKTVREKSYAGPVSALGAKFPKGTDERLKAFDYYKNNHTKISRDYAGKYVAIGSQGVVESEKDRRELLARVNRKMSSLYIKYIPEKGIATLY